jgi:DNA-binding IclR family transcriptional regulator
MKNKPPYAIGSVDRALQLAVILQEGPLSVTGAAERLGVSRSAAHRLLSMLVYRDFAEQDADRRYRAGPMLTPAQAISAPIDLLRRFALPHMRILVVRMEETANLLVLAGRQGRFLATVECDHVLRVSDRTGRALPAHLVSGGKALLASAPEEQITELYSGPDWTDEDRARLRDELTKIRERGFAINDQLTETGLTAVGVLVPWPAEAPVAALSLAMPAARFHRDMLPTWVHSLTSTAAVIATELAAGF